MVEDCPVDLDTGELLPVVTTDNGGPFRSSRFEAFIELHPELAHVRTRVKSPGQNGSRERGFGTLKYERLYIDEIDDAVMLAKHAEEYRIEYNQIRPHEAIAWNQPKQVHLGQADPTIPFGSGTNSVIGCHSRWVSGRVVVLIRWALLCASRRDLRISCNNQNLTLLCAC